MKWFVLVDFYDVSLIMEALAAYKKIPNCKATKYHMAEKWIKKLNKIQWRLLPKNSAYWDSF